MGRFFWSARAHWAAARSPRKGSTQAPRGFRALGLGVKGLGIRGLGIRGWGFRVDLDRKR